MRIVFIGSVKFSAEMLDELIQQECQVVGVCAQSEPGLNSDYCDLGQLAVQRGIPFTYTGDINSNETIDWIEDLYPDVIFCMGWSQILKDRLLSIPKVGVIGFHPTELPKNRGRHPIVWALVLGLEQTASTFFFIDSGVDSGDIVSQEIIPISDCDNAGSLYKKISGVARRQIANLIPQLKSGSLNRKKQENDDSNVWRKRREEDGVIDWRMSANSIHNLIRGLSHPYVGAYFVNNGEKIRVWKSKPLLADRTNLEPGRIMERSKEGLVIKCGEGSIVLLEIQPREWQPVGDYL